MPLPIAFRALAHRNYRLFVLGQGVSLIGTWMQQTGLSWLVYEMTNSPFLLGAVAFCGQIPAFFLAPVAGVLSDQFDRRRTLFITQAASMVQAGLLVLLMWSGRIAIWQIIALSAVLGVANAFDMPTRQAFLIDMAPNRHDLPNAIALNSSMVNLTRLIGPLLGGIVIAAGGVLACFVVNAVSYVAVIAALAAMRDLPPRPRSAARFGFSAVTQGLVEGFAYAFGFAPIRALLLMVAMQSLLGMPVTTLLPVFARDILHGDARVFGTLGSASGIGALGAALYLAQRRTVVGLGRPIAWAAAAFGGGLVAFSLSHSTALSMAILAITGFSMMLLLAGCNTLLQTVVDDDKRGRVMSLYAMAFMGTVPLGSLMAGTLASSIGAAGAARVSGLGCLVGAALFGWRLSGLQEQVRPIYERAGLAPMTRKAAAVETAAELQVPPERPS
ncbi:MAG: MFS transporter [Pirellulales bacterium]|nr:MFS transporter [Pirellulales bacterium]